MNENQEFIDNVSELVINFNTPIYVQGTPMKFDELFFNILVTDMKEINAKLEAKTDDMKNEKDIDTIVKAIDDLKKEFLIVPMFKFVNNGAKIVFLQTKLYTSNKGLVLSINKAPYNKANSKTFFDIARGFIKGGAITRAQARVVMGSQNRIMEPEKKALFPTRDYTRKTVKYLPEDIHEMKYENQRAATLFIDEFGVEQIQDLQGKFDINMYRAIESLSDVSNRNVMYNADNVPNNQRGGRNATHRRQRGGAGIDETLFETLYTLYVYRAQYDIELNTPDQSINMKVLRELYKDYPKSTLRSNERMTLNQLTGETSKHTQTASKYAQLIDS